nr:MAG TPA: hypothetical protein [Caudoviricetes sp.]
MEKVKKIFSLFCRFDSYTGHSSPSYKRQKQNPKREVSAIKDYGG